MSVNEQMVQDIVRKLGKNADRIRCDRNHGVFTDMNEAIEAAKKAQKVVARMSLTTEKSYLQHPAKRSWRTQRSWRAWAYRRPAWEMSDTRS